MTNRKDSGPISATELMARLEQDEDYQRRKAVAVAERRERLRASREAQQPIAAALRGVGVEAASVWELMNTAEPYPDALPVLMDHLEQGGYPDRVMEGLGRALAVKPAVVYWNRLKALYLAPRSPGEEDGVAVALAACATKAQLDDLIGLLALSERGQSRIYFLRPILKVGGARGLALVTGLQDDPVFGTEARERLKGRRPRRGPEAGLDPGAPSSG